MKTDGAGVESNSLVTGLTHMTTKGHTQSGRYTVTVQALLHGNKGNWMIEFLIS